MRRPPFHESDSGCGLLRAVWHSVFGSALRCPRLVLDSWVLHCAAGYVAVPTQGQWYAATNDGSEIRAACSMLTVEATCSHCLCCMHHSATGRKPVTCLKAVFQSCR